MESSALKPQEKKPRFVLSIAFNRYVLVFLLTALNLLVFGYEYTPNTYIAQDLPFIHEINNPDLYPDDLYVNTLKSFPSLYVYLMAWLSRLASLETIHLFLFLALRFLLFLAIFNLSSLLFRSRLCSLISVFMCTLSPLISIFGLWGEEPLMRNFLYHGSFTAPFLIFAITFFLRKKYISCFVLLAMIYYFNSLMANYLAVMFFFASVYLFRETKNRDTKKTLILSWVLFIILWLPFLVDVFSRPSLTLPTGQLVSLLKSWHPGHYFASSWSIHKWQLSALYLLVFSALLWKSRNKNTYHPILFYFLLAMFSMWLVAFIFSDMIPWPAILIMQFYRCDVFFVLFGTLAGASYISGLIRTRKVDALIQALFLILLLTNLNLFLSLRLLYFVFGFIILFIAKEYFIKRTKNENKKCFHAWIIRIYAVFFLAFCLIAVSETRDKQLSLLSLSALLLIYLLGEIIAEERHLSMRVSAMLGVLLFFSLIPYFSVIRYRIAKRSLEYRSSFQCDWITLQRWAQSYTSTEAKFLTPPYINGFRVFSKRTAFIERLDASAFHWHPSIYQQWTERCAQLGYKNLPGFEFHPFYSSSPISQQTQAIYNTLSREKILQLGSQYDLDYLVTYNRSLENFPLVYKNANFAVFRIE